MNRRGILFIEAGSIALLLGCDQAVSQPTPIASINRSASSEIGSLRLQYQRPLSQVPVDVRSRFVLLVASDFVQTHPPQVVTAQDLSSRTLILTPAEYRQQNPGEIAGALPFLSVFDFSGKRLFINRDAMQLSQSNSLQRLSEILNDGYPVLVNLLKPRTP